MRKKSLLLFLLAVLCLITVSAAVTASAISVEIADASGSCGSSMTWHFEAATGTLTVTGSGTMDTGEHPPWDDLDEYIVSVVIEEGVTSISHGAFSGMQQLTSVDLPVILFFTLYSGLVEDVSFMVTDRDDLCSELIQLLDRSPCNIAVA